MVNERTPSLFPEIYFSLFLFAIVVVVVVVVVHVNEISVLRVEGHCVTAERKKARDPCNERNDRPDDLWIWSVCHGVTDNDDNNDSDAMMIVCVCGCCGL